jgi:hypothetical protein
MLQYTYRPLPLTPGCCITRVLQLLPRRAGTDRIGCHLVEYSLVETEEDHDHQYEALS